MGIAMWRSPSNLGSNSGVGATCDPLAGRSPGALETEIMVLQPFKERPVNRESATEMPSPDAAFLIVDEKGVVVRASGWESLFGIAAPSRIATEPKVRDPLVASIAGAIREAADTGGVAQRRAILDVDPPRTIAIATASLGLSGRGANTVVVIQNLEGETPSDGSEGKAMRKLEHDLRSPVTSISGAAELLESGRLGTLTAEQSRCLIVIQKGVDSLMKMLVSAAMPFRAAHGTEADLFGQPSGNRKEKPAK